jgi:hypothetical protein
VDKLSAMDSAFQNPQDEAALYPTNKFHINVSRRVIHMIWDFFTGNREEIVFKRLI